MRSNVRLLVFLAPLALAQAPVQHVVEGASAPAHAIAAGKGSAKLLLNASTGATEAALTLLELEQGAEVPDHTHESSAEMLYIEQGTVEMRIADQTVTASAGDAVYIPAGAHHSAKVVHALRAVQMYVGPGPEQRFTDGPRL